MRNQQDVGVVHDAGTSDPSPREAASASRAARWMLAAFLLTFIVARVLVYLIMSRAIPDLFQHIGGTHVHHLNHGIFLLSGVGAYLIFRRPAGRRLTTATTIYGIGLGLTFDEFGMWLHLGGGYWQRASFDAVVVIASLLGLIVAAPSLKHFRPRHWATAVVLLIAVLVFVVMIARSLSYAERTIGPRLERLDAQAPP